MQVTDVIVFPTRLDAFVLSSLELDVTLNQAAFKLNTITATASINATLTGFRQRAAVVVSAVMSDATRLPLTAADGLVFLSDSDGVEAISVIDDEVFAERNSNGSTNLVIISWLTDCDVGGVIILSTTVAVTVVLPVLTSVEIYIGNSQNANMTSPNDPLTSPPMALAGSLLVTVIAFFADGTERDVSSDTATVISVVTGMDKVTLSKIGGSPYITAVGPYGTAAVRATFQTVSTSVTCNFEFTCPKIPIVLHVVCIPYSFCSSFNNTMPLCLSYDPILHISALRAHCHGSDAINFHYSVHSTHPS